jgi:predicted DNA-binding transcriptional regulator AlpA
MTHPACPEAATTTVAALPETAALADVLRELSAVLSSLRREPAPVPRMTYRLDELADSLGVSRRCIERERAAGRFPRPDLIVGKMPLWKPATVENWMSSKGGNT